MKPSFTLINLLKGSNVFKTLFIQINRDLPRHGKILRSSNLSPNGSRAGLCGLPGYIPKAIWMWTPVNVLSFTQDHFSLHANLVSECRLDKLEWQVSWKKNRGNRESNPWLLGCESTNLYPCQNFKPFFIISDFHFTMKFSGSLKFENNYVPATTFIRVKNFDN